AGADVGAAAGLSRFGDRVTYVLGAAGRDLSTPQLWLYKDNAAPARLIAQGGADLRLLQYGNPAAGEWFPRIIELWTSGQLAPRGPALKATLPPGMDVRDALVPRLTEAGRRVLEGGQLDLPGQEASLRRLVRKAASGAKLSRAGLADLSRRGLVTLTREEVPS